MEIKKNYLFSLILIAFHSHLTIANEYKIDNPNNYLLSEDVLWSSPGGLDLTMDIYTPKTGRDSYPVLMIFHGGGWLINDKSIMDQTARYLATNSEFVICNIDYRLLGENGNTIKLNQIVNDAFGSVLWVKEHIGNYKGDQSRISVSGDSAGGHLAAMIVNSGHRLSSASYTESQMFLPTYLPQGVTPESLVSSNGLAVQAAILSYPALDGYQNGDGSFESWKNPLWFLSGSMPRGVFGNRYNAKSHPELYKAISPLYSIPDNGTRILPPQLILIGSEDRLIKPSLIQAYSAKLKQAGHPAQYWIYEGRGHAYLDSGSSFILGTSFERDAPDALNVMINFLNNIFYP